MRKRVAVIGGGLIGLSVAYKLLSQYNNIDLDLYEKEKEVGLHQSGRNSGVLHCGLYYKPGSLKARLAVSGIQEMTDFCRENEIVHEICGKVVVATTDEQVATLRKLGERGVENGLANLKFLSSQELAKREPYVRAKEALLVPQEGIVDYKSVMNKLVEKIQHLNGKIFFGSKIDKAIERANEVVLITHNSEKSYDLIVNCCGLYSDKTFKNLAQQSSPIKIVPFRGEYLKLKDSAEELVNHLIYPTPDIKYPFLGVHFTRLFSGEREVGPNAVLAFKREGYKLSDFSFSETLESLTYPGLLRFIGKNFGFAMDEFYSSMFMNSFLKKAKQLIPEINSSMLEKGTSGVRAQAMANDGALIMDFCIERVKKQIHVLNAPSPGATSSLAIADYIVSNYVADLL